MVETKTIQLSFQGPKVSSRSPHNPVIFETAAKIDDLTLQVWWEENMNMILSSDWGHEDSSLGFGTWEEFLFCKITGYWVYLIIVKGQWNTFFSSKFE